MLTWALDARGAIIFRSPEWSDITGIVEPDLRSRLRSQAIHPGDFDRVERSVDEAVEARSPFLVSYRLRRADHSYGWVTTGGAPSFSPVDGGFVGYLGTTHEIAAPPAASCDGRAHRSVVMLDYVAGQISTLRSLARQQASHALVKVLDMALLIVGDLLFQTVRR